MPKILRVSLVVQVISFSVTDYEVVKVKIMLI